MKDFTIWKPISQMIMFHNRVAIIEYLIKEQKCINSNLVKELGLAQATISQHLRELKEIGIIQGTIDGVSVSTALEGRAEAGVLLMRGLVANYPHLIDAEKTKAIQSIIEMADETESPTFEL